MERINIRHNGVFYGMILRHGPVNYGATWVSEDKHDIQVGIFQYDKGDHLRAHTHTLYPREANRTCETMVMEYGSISITTYTDEGKAVAAHVLNSGDVYISLAGGHSFDVLKDGTRIVEVKNGPYFGVEKDKVFFEPELKHTSERI